MLADERQVTNVAPSAGYAFGPFVLNLQRMSLQREGLDLELRPKAFDVLRHLIERPGSVVTKDELMAAAWPNVIVADDALTQCIRDIRKALGGEGEPYIRTVPRRGYLFAADVTVLDAAGARKRRRAPMAAVLALVAAVALVAVVWFTYLRSAETAPSVVAATNPTVAVLPFDDMNGNPDLAYFGEGVSGDIIAMLARVPDLGVVARNSSFRYRGQAIDIRQVGEELGATHVLEGSVRKDADRLRIVAQLIDARTGQHIWAERFDRTGTDPWALQDEVTEKIVAALVGFRGMIKRAEYRDVWGKDSADLREYDYVLRGGELVLARTPEALEQAFADWKEGQARFPDSGLLKTHGASLLLVRLLNNWSDTPEEDFRHAGKIAREAMAQPNLSPLTRKTGHWVLAYVNLAERNFDQALVEAEAAIAMASHDGNMLFTMAEIPIAMGQRARALEWIDRAAELFPENDPVQSVLMVYRGWAWSVDGQWEQALAALSDPRVKGVAPLRRYVLLVRAICLVELDRLDEAKAEIRQLLELDPTYSQDKVRKRNLHFEPALVEQGVAALALAGLPED